jgi:murein DD-endopeptidase MepM/ murein hydrolase activator NlpD
VQQIKIGPDQDGTVLIRHNSKLVSVYGGLKEILVKPNAKISADDAIGRTGSSFYFEVRNEDSPVNPINIFK